MFTILLSDENIPGDYIEEPATTYSSFEFKIEIQVVQNENATIIEKWFLCKQLLLFQRQSIQQKPFNQNLNFMLVKIYKNKFNVLN